MYLGIDIGSISINAVLVDSQAKLAAWEIDRSGYDHKASVSRVVERICRRASIEPNAMKRVVGTGYGRRNIPLAQETFTEITCHAVGTRALFDDVETVIDIGGQDSKVIRLSPQGKVEDFIMNDKCAAGTGRFLEVMASTMGMDIDTFSRCGLDSRNPFQISSTCTVFAESEVVSGIARGISRKDLVAGIHEAIVRRIGSMARSAGASRRVVLTGGVAKSDGIAQRLRGWFSDLRIPEEPQITGALGAAILGWRHDHG